MTWWPPRGAGWLRRSAGTLVVLVVIGGLGLAVRDITLEQDPVRSLADPDPVRARLFSDYQTRNPLQGKVFIEATGQDDTSRARLEGALAQAGYLEVSLFKPPSIAELVALATLLPTDEVGGLLSDEAIRRRAATVVELAALPGTATYLEAVIADPLGLAPAVAARLGLAPGAGAEARPVRVFKREGPLDYDRVAALSGTLSAFSPRVFFIGGDFFSLENYRAVQHDIVVNSILSLALNLLIFYGFTGRWALLGLLFLGSVVSYLTGLLTTWLFYADIQAVVLAYTSTFVGFNNESLVHLAGIEAQRRRTTLLGIWSAIGTTVIGFLVLLAGHSTIVRQMALASLGGMLGFLLFLIPYRSTINAIRFRTIDWRPMTIRPWTLILVCAAAAGGTAVVGLPGFATQIDEFRYETPSLTAAVQHFSQRLEDLSLEDVVAVHALGDPGSALAPLAERGMLDLTHHPLAAWIPTDRQQETLRTLAARSGAATALLDSELLAAGLQLSPTPPVFGALGAWEYLERIDSFSPVRWSQRVGERRFVMASVKRGWVAPLPADVAPVTPRRYYNTLLTSLSRELGWLFLAGLAVMAIYLAALQRSALRVLYVFAPLFFAGFAFALYSRFSGTTLNIIHVMGFSLVIGLAMDYTAVAVSSDHAPAEISKVILTGLSTFATFGVLILARHPVLRDLGITVVLGCGISLVFALFIRIAPPGTRPT